VPRIPFVSNLTGDWIRPSEATDPAYWARHLCGKVRFGEGVEALAGGGHRVLLEVGPGHALRMLAAQLDVWGGERPTIVASLRHGYERHPDAAHVLGAAGRLWAAGAPVDWKAVHAPGRRRRVPLPTYPFERARYWVEGAGDPPAPAGGPEIVLHPRPARAGAYHAPANPAEEVLVGIWRELLGIGEVGVRDDFFHLGGHSLLGMRVIARVRDAFQVELPLRAVFEAPTIAALAGLIDEAILLQLDEMSDDEAAALLAASPA
jgi:hypothetical protein